MVKRVLGIIGEGNAVQHFFSYNGGDDVAKRKRSFLGRLDGVVFYNHSFNRDNDYFEARLKSVDNYLSSIISSDPKSSSATGGTKESGYLTVSADFEKMMGMCDVIIDATRGYRFPSVYGIAMDVAAKVREMVTEGSKTNNEYRIKLTEDNCKDDFKGYNSRSDADKRKMMDYEKFRSEWNTALAVLRISAQVNLNMPIGFRTLDELPFNSAIMCQRGKELQGIIEKGLWPPPTYINLANEPCLTSAMMVGSCPEMASYVVACTGFDLQRLQNVLEEFPLYNGIREKCEVAQGEVVATLRGIHDEFAMVPALANRTQESKTLERLMANGLKYNRVHEHLKAEVGEYWKKYNTTSGNSESRDVNCEVDCAFMDLADNAFKSRGAALSVFPPLTERGLCNGYFRLMEKDSGRGLFLVGEHRFCNGRVISDE